MDPVIKQESNDTTEDANGSYTTQCLQSSQDNGSSKTVQQSEKNSDSVVKKEKPVQASGNNGNPDNKHYPPWWTKEVEEARRDKNRHYNKFRRSGKDSDWIAFKKARAFARYTIRNAKADHEEKTQAANRNKEGDLTESSTSKDGQNATQTEETKSTEENMMDNSESTENETPKKDSEECAEEK